MQNISTRANHTPPDQPEGQRLEQEISEYAQLSKSTVSATRLIADNMLNWKKTESKKT
jgi:hypothetical protein